MTLYLMGTGLRPDDISHRALSILQECESVFLDTYTSVLPCTHKQLEEQYGVQIVPADRALVEQHAEERLLKPAKENDIALLVVGDPLSATTHVDLLLRAREKGVPVEVIQNASVLNAVARTGLQLYKFGKTGSIAFPEPGYVPDSHYKLLEENQSIGAHTLLLLDLKPHEGKYLTVTYAIDSLLAAAKREKNAVFTDKTLCVACARLGWTDETIVAGAAGELRKLDLGQPPYCLIIPGRLHFVEEEAIGRFKQS